MKRSMRRSCSLITADSWGWFPNCFRSRSLPGLEMRELEQHRRPAQQRGPGAPALPPAPGPSAQAAPSTARWASGCCPCARCHGTGAVYPETRPSPHPVHRTCLWAHGKEQWAAPGTAHVPGSGRPGQRGAHAAPWLQQCAEAKRGFAGSRGQCGDPAATPTCDPDRMSSRALDTRCLWGRSSPGGAHPQAGCQGCGDHRGMSVVATPTPGRAGSVHQCCPRDAHTPQRPCPPHIPLCTALSSWHSCT